MRMQYAPGTVVVPDNCTSEPATAVTWSMTLQLPTLGVPIPRPTEAPGTTLGSVTFTAPIVLTVNWWVFAPNTRSVSLNVSSTVGTAGVGVAGATGSPHPVERRTAPNTTQRIRFICP